MKSKIFSLFLITILGFSIVSIPGLGDNFENYHTIAHHSVSINEDLEISGGFGSGSGQIFSVSLDERLKLFNNDRQFENVSTVYLSNNQAIMDRILVNARVRNIFENEIFEHNSKVTISDFIETISNTFYDGGAKTPSLPSIPIAVATSGPNLSTQLSQNISDFDDSFELLSENSSPSRSTQNSGFSQYQLFNGLNNFELDSIYYVSDVSEISSTPSHPNEFNNAQIIVLIVTSSGFIVLVLWSNERRFTNSFVKFYFVLFVIAYSIPAGPKLEHPVKFYCMLTFYLVTTFSTPYAIGNSYLTPAYGEMDDSEEEISIETINPVESEVIVYIPEFSSSDESDVTQTDNVADLEGPKNYSVFLSEDVTIGDGAPTNNQQTTTSEVQQTEIPVESIPTNNQPIELSESLFLGDSVVDQPQQNDIILSESISLSDDSSKQIILGDTVILFEKLSFQDAVNYESFTSSGGNVYLFETVLLSSQTEGAFGIASIKISESISLYIEIDTVLKIPFNEIIFIVEALSISHNVSVNGNSEISLNEPLVLSDKMSKYIPIMRIYENLFLLGELEKEETAVSFEDIENITLLPEENIIELDGAEYVTASDDLTNSINAITISAWINPDFENSAQQMTIISKELSFQIILNNNIIYQKMPSF